jgi:zinc/manganese transport system substrate-binding protein/zinc transport system substrate-binding protein
VALVAWFVAVLMVAPGAALAQAKLRLIATTPDLASLAEAVGGERVAVSSIVPPGLDPEEYQPRPRDLARLRGADALIRVGVDYDLWLERLLSQAQNAALARGAPGYIDASVAIALLDVRGAAVGPGHPHGSGNPHYWLDPANAEIITGNLLEALARLDPQGAKQYERRRIMFLERLEAKRREWQVALAPFQGRALIAYHNNWAYLARRFRLDLAGFIEIKPGVPPSPAHLASLLQTMREKDIAIIVRQPHEPARNTEFLARRSGAAVVVLAASVGAVPEVRDYIGLFDYNIKALAAGFSRHRST